MPLNVTDTSSTIFNLVTSVLLSVKNYDQLEVVEDTSLIEQLGFTSLDVMNFILALEQRFQIIFQDEHLDLDHFVTVGAVLRTLRSYPIEGV